METVFKNKNFIVLPSPLANPLSTKRYARFQWLKRWYDDYDKSFITFLRHQQIGVDTRLIILGLRTNDKISFDHIHSIQCCSFTIWYSVKKWKWKKENGRGKWIGWMQRSKLTINYRLGVVLIMRQWKKIYEQRLTAVQKRKYGVFRVSWNSNQKIMKPFSLSNGQL